MFTKPFRIKSQTRLKSSEKKKFRNDIQKCYPSLQESDLLSFLPNKEDAVCIRLYSFKGDSICVYMVGKNPLFFQIEKEKELYPTVYTLWSFPELLPSFTTHPSVLERLANGADLMIAGIIVKDKNLCPTSFGKFGKGDIVAVDMFGNRAPIAVGVTCCDSYDFYMSGNKGKGVSIYHVYTDHLWELGSQSPLPELGTLQSNEESENKLETERATQDMIVADGIADLALNVSDAPESVELPVADNVDDSTSIFEDPVAKMDQLLAHCFYKAWKTSAKKISLPILTLNFYLQHMVPAAPDGVTLNVKRSSYKKLSKFLDQMQKKGIIKIMEYPKGVDNITEVNFGHEELMDFTFDENETTIAMDENAESGKFVPPAIEELYQVSGDTIQFFRSLGYSKGDVLTSNEVRMLVTNYIKKNELQVKSGNLVSLNSTLHEAVVNRKEGYKETLRWDEIFSRMLGKMSPACRITRPGMIPIIKKGKLTPIELSIAKRTGNKVVTLIHYVNEYGIDEKEFAHEVQVGVATSTSIGPAEHKPKGTNQILIQGNQIHFAGKLLLEKYKISKKYIRGLELAPKNKK